MIIGLSLLTWSFDVYGPFGRLDEDMSTPKSFADMRLGLSALVSLSLLAGGISYSTHAAAHEPLPPAGAIEIDAPEPHEISGVASIPGAYGGFAVVGDEENNVGWIWPGGAKWRTAIKGSVKRAKGLEAVDVGLGPNGEEVWMVLGENNRTLSNLYGLNHKLPKTYEEICGRGLEGLTVRWKANKWQVAVLWEGGHFDSDKCGTVPEPGFSAPRVAVFDWVPGQGVREGGSMLEFELKVPDLTNNQRFRAPDLTWLDDHSDRLVVLLGSTGANGGNPFDHTWLQVFDFSGKPVADFKPYKLEEEWGKFRSGRNWEALDQSVDRSRLVMGFDAKTGSQSLIVFPSPFGR